MGMSETEEMLSNKEPLPLQTGTPHSLPFKGAALWESSWTMTRPLHGLPSDSLQTQSLLQFVASFPSPSQLCARIQKVL